MKNLRLGLCLHEVDDDEEELISDEPEEDEPPSYEDVVTDDWDAAEVVCHKPEEHQQRPQTLS